LISFGFPKLEDSGYEVAHEYNFFLTPTFGGVYEWCVVEIGSLTTNTSYVL